MTDYAGIDLSMKTTAVCVVDEAGKTMASASVDSTPETIAELLSSVGQPDRCVIETGRMRSAICLGLRQLGINVVCIDA
jgi:transposase